MRFGIVTDCYGIGLPLEQALTRLSRIGFRDVEIVGGHLAEDITAPPSVYEAKARIRYLKKLISNLGIAVCQLHGPYGVCDLVAETETQRKRNIDIYKRWIDWSLALEAGALIIHIGGRNDLCPVKDIEFIICRNVDSLCRLAEHVEGTVLKLAIENLPSRCADNPNTFNLYGNTVSELKEIVSAVGSDNLGICLDVGHANIEGLDVPSAVIDADNSLVATHIQENNGVYDMHMLPFSLRRLYSKMAWFAIFKAFKKIEYPYPLIGECANTSGELPFEIVDIYLKHQKELLDTVMKHL